MSFKTDCYALNNIHDIIFSVFAVTLHSNSFHCGLSPAPCAKKNLKIKKFSWLKNQEGLIQFNILTFHRMLNGAEKKYFFLVLAVTIFNRCFKSKPYLLISFEWSILSLFLSSLSIDALKPRDSIDSIMSRGPVVSVSYTNRPLLVANATDAFSIPFLLVRFDSIKWTHEEQVMPVICNKKRNRTLYPSYHWT